MSAYLSLRLPSLLYVQVAYHIATASAHLVDPFVLSHLHFVFVVHYIESTGLDKLRCSLLEIVFHIDIPSISLCHT
jgi:hypothetical protein